MLPWLHNQHSYIPWHREMAANHNPPSIENTNQQACGCRIRKSRLHQPQSLASPSPLEHYQVHDPLEDDPSPENVLPPLCTFLSKVWIQACYKILNQLLFTNPLMIKMLELHMGIAIRSQLVSPEASGFTHSRMWVLPNRLLVELTNVHRGKNLAPPVN